MLFKNAEGVYVEILRSNYTTDTAYYRSIMTIKGCAKVNVNENEMNINEMNINVNENEMSINEMNVNENKNEMNENKNINETKINEMSRIRSILRKHP